MDTNNMALAPDAVEIRQFLELAAPTPGRINLTSIKEVSNPDGTLAKPIIEGGRFTNMDDATAWCVVQAMGGAGVYCTLNEVDHTFTKAKPKKAHIRAAMVVHADADPRPYVNDPALDDDGNEAAAAKHYAAEKAAILAKVEALPLRPTMAWDSGNGIGVAYKLTYAEHTKNTDPEFVKAEEHNRALRMYFGEHGDAGTENADRVLRVPGTPNFPSAKKRSIRKTASMSRLIESGGRTYKLAEVAEHFPPVPKPTGTATGPPAGTRDGRSRGKGRRRTTAPAGEAPALVLEDVFQNKALAYLIRHGKDPVAVAKDAEATEAAEELAASDELADAVSNEGDTAEGGEAAAATAPKVRDWSDRSNLALHLCARLYRMSITEGEIHEIAFDPANKGFDHFHRQPDDDAKERAFARAMEVAADTSYRKFWFVKNKDGDWVLPPSESNLRVALRKMRLRLRYNEFNGKDEFMGAGITLLGKSEDGGETKVMDDQAYALLHGYLRKRYGLNFKSDGRTDSLKDVLNFISKSDPYHPVKDWFEALPVWDKVPRIERLLPDYCGGPDTPYQRDVGACLFKSIVKRIYDPGCELHELPVFEGGQGNGKTSLCKLLSIMPKRWYTAKVPLAEEDKKVIEATIGKLFVEIEEMQQKRGAVVDKIKAFISGNSETARLAYGRFPSTILRSWVMVGTTNDAQYLSDPTGNRRFLPLTVGPAKDSIKLDRIKADLQQLYAEALYRVMELNEPYRINKDHWTAAAMVTRSRMLDDPFTGPLTDAVSPAMDRLHNVPLRVKAEELYKVLDLAVAYADNVKGKRVKDVMTLMESACGGSWSHQQDMRFDGKSGPKRPGFILRSEGRLGEPETLVVSSWGKGDSREVFVGTTDEGADWIAERKREFAQTHGSREGADDDCPF